MSTLSNGLITLARDGCVFELGWWFMFVNVNIFILIVKID